MKRRQFIKAFFIGSAGLWLSSKMELFTALAQLSGEVRDDSYLLGKEVTQISLSPMFSPATGIKNEYPTVAVDDKDIIWFCWSEATPHSEEIRLSSFKEEKFNSPLVLNPAPSIVYQPEMVLFQGGGLVVWTQFVNTGEWKISARVIKNGELQSPLEISESKTIAWNPKLVRDTQQNIWIVWEELENDHFQIKARVWNKDQLSPVITINEEKNKDNRRPAIVATRDNKIWIAWDRYADTGRVNIIIRQLNIAGKFLTAEIPVTRSAGLDVAPSLTIDSRNRLWIAWHSNRWDNDKWDIPRWFQLRCYQAGKFFEPPTAPPGKSNERDGEIQSFEFITLHCTADDKICVAGRASHNFYLQFYQGGQWSPIYRFPEDGWGGRGKYLRIAEDSQGALWVARRDLNKNVLQKLTLTPEEATAGRKQAKGKVIPLVIKPSTPETVRLSISNAPKKLSFEPWGKYKFYFGDIHGHTWMSDGTGDLDEYFITRRDFYKLDFAALTDHDAFVGNSLLPSEWQEIKAITTHFNQPAHFITLYGLEWTTARWPQAFGHKNIYHTDENLPLFDHNDESTNTTPKLFTRLKEVGAIAIPHHIGWTGVDWENHDPAVQPLVEIISAHGAFEYMGNEPIPHRGGIKGCFVQDGLAKGLRFGIIGSTDSHGLIWHHRVAYKRDVNRCGWTCCLAPELTREAIWEALKARRCYATSGIWLRMVFEINEHIMGEEFQSHEIPKIRVNISSEAELKWIDIVRNNQTIFRYGGEGFSSRFTYEDKEIPEGVSFYYIRVICEDGNMAWSSPIWVDYKKS